MNEFILQCKGCNTILAISQNYVNDPFQTPYDAFHLGANVCQNNDIITSKETNDKGATYKELSCSKCNNVVGKTYEETVPGVANLRKLFQADCADCTTSEGSLGGTLPRGNIQFLYVSHV